MSYIRSIRAHTINEQYCRIVCVEVRVPYVYSLMSTYQQDSGPTWQMRLAITFNKHKEQLLQKADRELTAEEISVLIRETKT